MPCNYRHPEDDFFCFRFGVWYRALDCAYRTRYQTSESCGDCLQGIMNLVRLRSKVSKEKRLYPGVKPFEPTLETIWALLERFEDDRPDTVQRRVPRAVP
jgi:hypothetical protein